MPYPESPSSRAASSPDRPSCLSGCRPSPADQAFGSLQTAGSSDTPDRYFPAWVSPEVESEERSGGAWPRQAPPAVAAAQPGAAAFADRGRKRGAMAVAGRAPDLAQVRTVPEPGEWKVFGLALR